MTTSAETFAQSFWRTSAQEPALPAPALDGPIEVDALVIGAGFTGLSTALHLAELGRSVALVEAQEVGFGASGRNGGQVIPGLKYDPNTLDARFGKALTQAVGDAADLVFELIERHAIQCAPERKGWIQGAHAPSAVGAMTARAEEWAARGVPVDILSKEEIAERTGTMIYHGGWRDPRAGVLNPLDYARGLARAFIAAGGKLFQQTPVRALERKGALWEAATPSGRVSAQSVIVATNAYGAGLIPDLDRSVLQVQSNLVATEPMPELMRRTVLPSDACVSESRKLAVYYRKSRDGRLLFGGRGAVGPDLSEDLRDRLIGEMHRMFPQTRGLRIDASWSGQLALTLDHLPHLHAPEPGLYAALAYNGRGVAMATLTGRSLARHIVEGAEPLFSFSPIRPLAWHGLRRPVMNLGVRFYWAKDRLGLAS